jgi:N-acetylglucosamine-6-phosphate deacetylase
MAEAVRHAVLDAGVPLEKVAEAAASAPARVLGIDKEVGAIEVGKLADLVVLGDDLLPVAVIIAGQWQETS